MILITKKKNYSVSSSREEIEILLSRDNLLEKTISNNQKDIELYNFAKIEIFDKMKKEFPLDINEELKRHRKRNVRLKRSNINPITQLMTKWLLIRPFEKFSYYFYH